MGQFKVNLPVEELYIYFYSSYVLFGQALIW